MANTQSPSPTSTEALEGLLAQWRKTVEAELLGVPFEKKLVTKTSEGLSLQPLYSRVDLSEVPNLGSAPGEAPFIRGTNNIGYKNSSWEFSQEILASDCASFNSALLNDLMWGQNSVPVVLDCATRAGQDPDEASECCVARCGLSIADLKDLEVALAKVALDSIPVHIGAGSNALPIAATYLALAANRKVSGKALTGSLTADPVAEWVLSGKTPAKLEALYDALATWSKQAATEAPALRTIGVSAQPWFEAGASATQEIAFALSTAVEYVRALQARGVSVEQVASQIRFSFAIGPTFFMEIAKFRAFRSLWTRVLSAFGAEAAAGKVAIHARTGLYNKTLHDANVNMLRVTTEALSAVLGSVDSLHIGTFDEVSGKSDEFSRRIARNVHTLLAEEFNFTETADAAGGSWYIEKITDELARKAWALFQELEQQGGFVAALRAGVPQKLVAAVAADKEDAVAKRRTGVVGTNLFPNLKEKYLTIAPVDASIKSGLVAAIKARRPAAAPKSGDLKALIAAATAGATIGQLAKATVSGEAETIQAVTCRRLTAGFEELRSASEAFAKKTGSRPKVFLAKMGPVIQHKPRADFSAGFFAVGGFEPIAKQAFETAEAAAEAAAASGAPVAVLCSTDDTYPALVPAFAAAVKKAKPGIVVVLAGLPADKAVVEQFKAAGVDEFIHVRASVRDLLAKLLKQIGAL
jgi:methylmalonyl-CoA mutase